MIGPDAVLSIRPIVSGSMPGGAMWVSYLKEHYGDLASVVGLLVTFVGFVVTIRNVRKARQAAEEARQAAREALSLRGSQILANEIGTVRDLVIQAEAACHAKNWDDAISRFAEARSRLAVHLANPELSEQERERLRLTSENFGSILADLGKLLHSSEDKVAPPRISNHLNSLILILGEIEGRLQSKVMEI